MPPPALQRKAWAAENPVKELYSTTTEPSAVQMDRIWWNARSRFAWWRLVQSSATCPALSHDLATPTAARVTALASAADILLRRNLAV
jgi:hypothetical protein